MNTILDILAELLGVGRARFAEESRQRARRWGLVGILVVLLLCSGCATKAVNSHYAAGDSAIRMVGMDNNGVGVGVDMFRWQEVAAHPFAHLAGVGADVTSFAAVVKVVKDWLAKQGGNSDAASTPPATINVSGNNGPVTVNYGKRR